MEASGLLPRLLIARQSAVVQKLAESIPEWMIYSLPNALWLLAGLSALSAISRSHLSQGGLLAILFSVSAIALELGQITDLIAGTFDPVDVSLIAVTCGIAYTVLREPQGIHSSQGTS